MEANRFRVFIDGVESWTREGANSKQLLSEVVAENPQADYICVMKIDQFMDGTTNYSDREIFSRGGG